MKNKKIVLSLIGAILMIFGAASLCLAQEAEAIIPLDDTSNQPGQVVATVNIDEAKVVSQNGNNFSIYFSIYNQVGVQHGVKYAVEIYSKEKLIDKKVYETPIDLGNNKSVQKTISYSAPLWARGDYEMLLVVKNEQGMSLSTSSIDTVHLDGSNQSVDISDCYIVINDDQKNRYQPEQGIDFSLSEKATVFCTLKSNFASQVTVTPHFDTYLRSTFGTFMGSDKNDSVTLEANKTSEMSFLIPKKNKPQAYDTMLTLLDSQGNKVSNSMVFHYVIQGESGTISNLLLDKDNYVAGENASIAFTWSGSADIFLESRNKGARASDRIAEFSITDSSGKVCASNLRKNLSESDSYVEIKIPIQSDCVGARVTANLKNASGEILYQAIFAKKDKEILPAPINPAENKNLYIYAGFLIVTIILIIIIVIVRKRKIGRIAAFVLSFALIGGFFGGQEARAETFSYYTGVMWGPAIANWFASKKCTDARFCVYYHWTVNMKGAVSRDANNIRQYKINQQIPITAGNVTETLCDNKHRVRIYGRINNGVKSLIFDGHGNVAGADTLNFTAPNVIGNHKATFYFHIENDATASQIKTVNFNVIGCTGGDPVNANKCQSDDMGLSVNTAKTLVMSCSEPAGSAPKCQFVCKSGYELVNGVCTPCLADTTCLLHPVTSWGNCVGACGGNGTRVGTCDDGCGGLGSKTDSCTTEPCCYCDSSVNAMHCSSEGTYDNGCMQCPATKDCTSEWKEVTP